MSRVVPVAGFAGGLHADFYFLYMYVNKSAFKKRFAGTVRNTKINEIRVIVGTVINSRAVRSYFASRRLAARGYAEFFFLDGIKMSYYIYERILLKNPNIFTTTKNNNHLSSACGLGNVRVFFFFFQQFISA